MGRGIIPGKLYPGYRTKKIPRMEESIDIINSCSFKKVAKGSFN